MVLAGRVSQDGAIRYTASGKAVLEFHLQPQDTDNGPTIRVIGRRQQSIEQSESLIKGAAVVVEGQLVQRKIETESGHIRKLPEIHLDHLLLT